MGQRSPETGIKMKEGTTQTGRSKTSARDDQSAEKTKDIRLWSQCLAAVCAALGSASMGANAAFSSQLVRELQNESGAMKMTLEQASWIPTLFMAGSIISAPLSGLLSAKLGRRPVLCYTGFLVTASLLLVSFSTSKEMLLAGRLLKGLTAPMAHVPAVVYISETVSPNVRRTVGSFPSLFVALGMFTTYTGGYLFQWRWVSLLLIIFPALGTASLWFLPETPYWLVQAGKIEEARKSLQFSRGPKFDVDSELEKIVAKENEKLEEDSKHKDQGVCYILSRLCSLNFFLPASCIGVLYGLCQFNGIAVVIVYMSDVFKQSGTSIDYKMAPMFVGATRLLSACCAAIIIRKVQKKYLFIFAALFIGVGMACIGGFSHVKINYPEYKELVDQADFLPVLGATLACVGQALGVLPTLHILMSEVFPTDIRTVSVGLLQSIFGILHALGAKLYPTWVELFNFHGTFYIFAAVNVSMAMWAALTMANIDGMSLVEVETKYEIMRVNTLKSLQSFREKSGIIGIASASNLSTKSSENAKGTESIKV